VLISIVTGANTGIGKQTALELAKHSPAQLWIAARNIESGKETVEKIKSIAPSVDVVFLHMDLTSFDSIKDAAKTVLAETQRMDILMLNAGIVSLPPRSYKRNR
jgi:retinol dehydrogenase-12